ncbi:lytic murein transglycosylase [Permianibacter fluminis]|uniref:lytic murein transglycosylase n=1 Tax=Permianibacter fluminis TaxID=2738515 RepID=UPI001B7D8D77|nr:lytic murein transglycosylase [Permianibacter fluminis]
MTVIKPRGPVLPGIMMLALLAGCAGKATLSAPVVTPTQAIPPAQVVTATPAVANAVAPDPAVSNADAAAQAEAEAAAFAAGWPAFRDELRQSALSAGISEQTVAAVFADLQLLPRVVSQDRAQPHTVLKHEDYLQKVITEEKIQRARERFREHADLLGKLEAEYGVEGKFIIALWGVESSFGRVMGKHHIPSALATMAYEGRRREFFRKEFLASLRILDDGHIESANMRGSWAGAMGQCQFMPTSFLNFAADGDGDGHKDIWTNTADVLASIANYLHKNGWRRGETWGRQVRLTEALTLTPAQLKEARALSEWQALGVRRDTGADLPERDLPARLLLPENDAERAYLVYNNYDVLLRWNRSRHFATSVGYLAERIGYPPVVPEATPPTDSATSSGSSAGNPAGVTESP